MGKNLMCAWLLVALSASATGQNKVSVSDFGWMSGTWNGNVGGAPVERVCSAPVGGSMICMMRVIANSKMVWTEFSVLRETATGIVLDTRFFTADAQPSDPIATELRLKSSTTDEAIFENSNGLQPKMESISRTGSDAMKSHAELVDSDGKMNAIDAQWKRIQQAAPAPAP